MHTTPSTKRYFERLARTDAEQSQLGDRENCEAEQIRMSALQSALRSQVNGIANLESLEVIAHEHGFRVMNQQYPTQQPGEFLIMLVTTEGVTTIAQANGEENAVRIAIEKILQKNNI